MPKSRPVHERRHLRLPRPFIPMTRATTRQQCPTAQDEVLIIGAGLAGLSAGLRLLSAGKKVTIVESESAVGGRCRTETLESAHGTFDADTGATVLTMPHLIEAAIMSVGINPQELTLEDGRRWALTKLSPAYCGRFASGRHLHLYSDRDAMHRELQRFAQDKHLCAAASDHVTALQEGYDKQRNWAQEMFTLSYENFLAADFDSVLDVFSTPASASSMMRLLASGAFGSLGKTTQRHINDPEVERMFTFQALYAGVAPQQARGVYSVISHMDSTMGVYYPTYSIGDAAEFMAAAFTQAGGQLRLNTAVTGLECREDRVVGVELNHGSDVRPDAVISTVDLPITAGWLGKELNTARYSPSAVVIHGTIPTNISEQWDHASHHTISFGEKWHEIFAELTATKGCGQLMTDPSLLITRPAVTVAERKRTAGGVTYEPLSILAPAPNLDSAPLDWEAIQHSYVQEILATLEQRGFHGINTELAIARIDTPGSYYSDHGYGAGTPFALAHTVTQTGPFRPRNYPGFGINNLILAGAGTTPGVGVPTVLLSGALAARRVTGGGVR